MAVFTYGTIVWTIFCSTINVGIGAILLDFRVTPSVIKSRETTNVTIQCLVNEIPQFYGNQPRGYFYNERGERVLQQNGRSDEDKSGLALIRIIKRFQSQWQAIAQISSVAPTVAHKLDASVSGTDGVISGDLTRRSFLQVTWDLATSDAFGSYRCDAISFDSQENAIIATSQLSFGSSLDALDLLRLLQHNTTDGRETIDQQRQVHKSSRSLTEQLQSELQTTQKQTEQLQSELQATQNQTEQLQSELQASQNQTEQLQSELQTTQNQTEQLQSELQTTQNQTEQLQSELQTTQNQTEQLQSELQATQNQTEQPKSELQKLQNKTEKPKSELQKLQSKTEQLEFDLQKQQNRTEQLESELQKLQNQIEQADTLRSELEKIENRIDNLENAKTNRFGHWSW